MEQPQVSDFFELYFDYVRETEPPVVFHRWSLIASIGAWLGRQMYLPFGSSRIFPNAYVMFVGNPGTRKSTAIKAATRILGKAGYESFGPQQTSKEKFLVDLAANSWDDEGEEDGKGKGGGSKGVDILRSLNLGSAGRDTGGEFPHEVFIAADEFNNFLGSGNISFQSLLGELWDWDEPDRQYKQRLKNSKSIGIYQPTVSILGGNTPQQFAECFPLASIGQGFMSRLLLIHAEESGRKITFPPTPSESKTNALVEALIVMRSRCRGPMTMAPDAHSALDMIYRGWGELEDARFKHYSTRRFTHLLKLCLVICACRMSTELSLPDVIYANTLLAFAETTMPKAIGELGKSKNAEAANKLMQFLYAAHAPRTVKEMFKVVQNDVDSAQDLAKLLSNLQLADKIQAVKIPGNAETGYLARQRIMSRSATYTNYALLKGKEIT